MLVILSRSLRPTACASSCRVVSSVAEDDDDRIRSHRCWSCNYHRLGDSFYDLALCVHPPSWSMWSLTRCWCPPHGACGDLRDDWSLQEKEAEYFEDQPKNNSLSMQSCGRSPWRQRCGVNEMPSQLGLISPEAACSCICCGGCSHSP